MKIAITGHRPSKLGNDYDLISPLIIKIKSQLQDYIDYTNPNALISGMALGIDILWAELAIENKIPLIAAIPCFNQDKMWPEKSKIRYNKILHSEFTDIHYVTQTEYTPFCMQKRNEWMVDNCDLLIAVWDGTSGGTANCVKYAKQKSKSIKRIDINQLR